MFRPTILVLAGLFAINLTPGQMVWAGYRCHHCGRPCNAVCSHCHHNCCAVCGCCPCGDTCTGRIAYQQAQRLTWHGNYYDPAYGAPVALVVPPTAGRQTDYHWGVAGYRTTPIYHQFRRGFPGYIVGGSPSYFLPTPRWPSDTNQFGVYYVRAPW